MITPEQIVELRSYFGAWSNGRVSELSSSRLVLALLDEHALLREVADAAEDLRSDLGLVEHAPLVLALRKARGAK